MGKTSSSYSLSSSISSNSNNPAFTTASSLEHLPTDLRLSLSISPSPHLHSFISRGKHSDKRTLGRSGSHAAEVNSSRSFFVKVYMEGIPIGRKLNLLAQHGYRELIKTLEHMFDTTITLGSEMEEVLQPERWHVLTYEDDEGDLIMVGDIPWEMFLSSVRRLRITRVGAFGR